MKAILLVLSSLLVLVILNLQVVKKEQLLKEGQTMLLRLAPRDPRSLMQGDYMRLNYAIAREVNPGPQGGSGLMVVSLDSHQVVKFLRIHQDETLQPGEHLLRYYERGGELKIGAESYLFQEGNAELYAKAVYGMLKVDSSGKSVLVGLCGEDFRPINPKGMAVNSIEP